MTDGVPCRIQRVLYIMRPLQYQVFYRFRLTLVVRLVRQYLNTRLAHARARTGID